MIGVPFEADIVARKGCIMYHLLDKSLTLLNMTVMYTRFKIHHLFHTIQTASPLQYSVYQWCLGN